MASDFCRYDLLDPPWKGGEGADIMAYLVEVPRVPTLISFDAAVRLVIQGLLKCSVKLIDLTIAYCADVVVPSLLD